ncbi:MAG: hypothetical protein AAF597_06275 [Bacteroidota bacterium]
MREHYTLFMRILLSLLLGFCLNGTHAQLSFGGRYNVDLNDLYDFKDQDVTPNWREVKWRSFDITVGYGLTLDFF